MDKQLVSSRLGEVKEYYFSRKLREVAALRAQGVDVLNLGIGSPDISPPKEVETALLAGLSEPGYHQYQAYKGIPELRQAFAKWYQTHFGVSLEADSEVLPLIGSKEGIMHIAMAFLDEGDQVLVPNPGYPSYSSACKMAGAELIYYPLREENNYYPDFEWLAQKDLSKIKIMWINFPHMPTGTDSSEVLFEQLKNFSRKHQIIIVNDNPYAFILTDQQRSLLKSRKQSDLLLELSSLSKAHNMAGWRVGALSGNAKLIQAVLTFKSNMDSGQFKPVMKAAIAALNSPKSWYESLNKEYRKRRILVFDIAQRLGCNCRKDQVGMFVWCTIPDSWKNSEEFADHLLETYQIFVPPGTVFGSEGTKYIRFSLCSDVSVWREVLERIQKIDIKV
ncbi:MAG: aminotransferase class I/II-fold pyridoxal phosphate-dependent enzyme [Bacteroidota bacterium]